MAAIVNGMLAALTNTPGRDKLTGVFPRLPQPKPACRRDNFPRVVSGAAFGNGVSFAG